MYLIKAIRFPTKKNWGHFDGFLGDLASWKDIMKELDVAINLQNQFLSIVNIIFPNCKKYTCPICKIHLFKLQNEFLSIVKIICPNSKKDICHLSNLQNIFVQIAE